LKSPTATVNAFDAATGMSGQIVYGLSRIVAGTP
jgi:hypothetical protein